MVEVDPAALQRAGEEAAAVHDELRVAWGAVEGRARQLFGGTWRGAAADSYTEPWAECVDGFEKVLASLAMMSQAVVEASWNYVKVDSSAAAGIASTSRSVLDI